MKAFRRKAASPFCHPLRRRMNSSDFDPYIIHASLGPMRVIILPQTTSRSVQPILQSSCTNVTNRQRHRLTDRPRISVCSNRPLSLANAAMQPNNNNRSYHALSVNIRYVDFVIALDWVCPAGWDYFDANEVGFRELYQLFSLAVNQLGQQPIVIDADDLLSHPGLCQPIVMIVVCLLQIFSWAYSSLSSTQLVTYPVVALAPSTSVLLLVREQKFTS